MKNTKRKCQRDSHIGMQKQYQDRTLLLIGCVNANRSLKMLSTAKHLCRMEIYGIREHVK